MPSASLQSALLDDPFWLGALSPLLCYAAGSVPFGYLVARARGLDIRQCGSGNIGATNVGRMLGKRYGFLVFALDFAKGFIPVLGVRLVTSSSEAAAFARYDLPVLCGLAAVLGHIFPVWLGFRGGKAGATGLGVGVVLAHWPALAAAVVWLLVVLATRYVSLGTMLASASYVLAYLVLAVLESSPLDREHMTLSLFCVVVAALVIVRHRSNIQRLLAGTESKV